MTNRNMKRRQRRMRKQILLTVCLMLVVCLVSVGGTLAWLTATSGEVVNTFSPTDIEVTLTENTPNATERQNIKLIPGVDITKDPKVSANSDIPYYVFVKITEGNWNVQGVSYEVADDWTALDSVVGVYYKEMPNGGNLSATSVLKGDKVTVANTLTKDQMPSANAKPSLTFKAYAIQMEGTGTASEAWTKVSGN